MGMNDFAPDPTQNGYGYFIVKNINPKKVIKIFNYPIFPNNTRDILKIPGIDESDIRGSLLKGELRNKIQVGDIEVIYSDIDLLQFNLTQKSFLQNSGITIGLEVGPSQFEYLKKEDIRLVGIVDGINNLFTIPSGKFIYDSDHNIIVYRNGVKQLFLDDYIIAESGGPSTGYDTIIMSVAPVTTPSPDDVMTADYFISNI